MIGIVDYGAGNMMSVRKAFSFLGVETKILAGAADFGSVDRVVLPGVGSFGYAMDRIRERGLFEKLNQWMASGFPLLGICLGLQLLAESSRESPGVPGFGIFRGPCRKFLSGKVPQIGWNSLRLLGEDDLLSGIKDGEFVYFANSYYQVPEDESCVLAVADYGVEFVASLRKGRVCGVQFHPEKSGPAGLRLIKNWVERC